MERARASCFFSPPGRSRGSGMRGARVVRYGNVAPSSDPSGHLLPGGEKKQAAMPMLLHRYLRLTGHLGAAIITPSLPCI